MARRAYLARAGRSGRGPEKWREIEWALPEAGARPRGSPGRDQPPALASACGSGLPSTLTIVSLPSGPLTSFVNWNTVDVWVEYVLAESVAVVNSSRIRCGSPAST